MSSRLFGLKHSQWGVLMIGYWVLIKPHVGEPIGANIIIDIVGVVGAVIWMGGMKNPFSAITRKIKTWAAVYRIKSGERKYLYSMWGDVHATNKKMEAKGNELIAIRGKDFIALDEGNMYLTSYKDPVKKFKETGLKVHKLTKDTMKDVLKLNPKNESQLIVAVL